MSSDPGSQKTTCYQCLKDQIEDGVSLLVIVALEVAEKLAANHLHGGGPASFTSVSNTTVSTWTAGFGLEWAFSGNWLLSWWTTAGLLIPSCTGGLISTVASVFLEPLRDLLGRLNPKS